MGIDAVMFATTSQRFGEQALRRLSADLAAAIGPEYFLIDRAEGRHALSAEDADALDFWVEEHSRQLRPPPGGQFLQVNIFARYYGEHYERGPWPILGATIGWLLHRLPDASVWYGGDGDGALEEMTLARRTALWTHWFTVGHDPYRRGFGVPARGRACGFCGGRPFTYVGGGGSGEALHHYLVCDGCGLRLVELGPEHIPYEVPRGVDFFDWEQGSQRPFADGGAS